MKSVMEIISREQLAELRENGWVVIHREPTDAMCKSFYGSDYPQSVDTRQGLHRVIATSIRDQNQAADS